MNDEPKKEADGHLEGCERTGKTYEAITGDGVRVEFCSDCHQVVSIGNFPREEADDTPNSPKE